MNQYSDAHAGASAPDCTAEQTKPAKPKKRQPSAAALELAAYNLLADRGIDGQLAADYMALRNLHKAPLTKTALAGIEREANSAGLSLTQAITVCCERGWRGFKAEWLLRDADHHPPGGSKPPRQNSINRIPQHTNGGVHLAKDIL
ncbi:hypothetical protein L1281_002297 [Neisseria sp. HSC-16F19]|nr:hypothetical protein [Neisseria sp. HSC-16F19]MCP2041686.1 hypothetical protein [Neisseria sp. HSC-16F19]